MTDRRVDVLIAGAGAAGLRAALAAREAGAERVLIVSKTESGVANCSGIAWGG
ncbi:MAG TPA: FAD-binding protein, partial [Armatimonadota bacterium]|nr:FAD-binding protein [Armatimonadota bacterium]